MSHLMILKLNKFEFGVKTNKQVFNHDQQMNGQVQTERYVKSNQFCLYRQKNKPQKPHMALQAVQHA